MPAAEESDAVRVIPAEKPGPLDYSRKYAGIESTELRRVLDELRQRSRAVSERIGNDLFASGHFETLQIDESGGHTVEGPYASQRRHRRENGVYYVDVAKWLPADYPEVVDLESELFWLEWKLQLEGWVGQSEPPRSPPAR
jgi:hypothetical protein